MLGAQFPQALAAARSGAEWAWTLIYRELAPAVLGYLRGSGADEPDDLTGEVFLQVVRDVPAFRGDEGAFRAWVFVIARHRMIDAGRRRERRPVAPMAEAQVEAVRQGDAEEEALACLEAEEVRGILESLSPSQRDVLLLRVLGDLTVDEVASAIHKRRGAVKALQRRGLDAVFNALQERAAAEGELRQSRDPGQSRDPLDTRDA